MRKIIAIDVDDVLIPHFDGLVRWYNARFGTHVTEAHNHSDDVTPWGVTTVREAVRRVHGYFDSDEFKHEQPYKDALGALRKLNETFNLVILTGRDEIIEDVTMQWLERYFPALFKKVHFTRQYSLEGKSRSKTEVIRAIGASYFVDDYPKAVFEVAASGVESILFGDYGWNQVGALPDGVTRCEDWAAVLEYFDGRR